MKFLELRLLAYGPFHDLTLDFSAPKSRMHVIYGRNEAGKSTSLRAVMGLLYGIPRITPDAHVHKNTDLRIGGLLEGADGVSIEVVRRKGNLNTLLGPKGEAVDEAILKRMLGGVGEEVYRTTFGLNHETLREGGKSLLVGKGDLGESLFQAGLGGSEVHQVLAQLRAEADAIFTARAHTRPLNDALKAHTDAQKRAKESALSADAWVDQKKAIEVAAADRDAHAKERVELVLEQKRAQRARRVLPILGKRAHLERSLAALGETAALGESATRDRLDAIREKNDARGSAERLLRELSEIEARRARLVVPDSLVDHGEAVLALHDRLGAHKKASADLPRLVEGLERSEADARRILLRIGRDLPLAETDALRLDAATQARIKRLARDYARLGDQATQAARACVEAEAALASMRAREDGRSPPRDPEPLRRAVDRAQQQGDLEERARAERSRVKKLEEAAEGKKRALGLWSGALLDAPLLPLPALESVERFASREAARTASLSRLEAKKKDTLAELARVKRETDALLGGGAVPTEDELHAARSSRDEGWREVTKAWENKAIDAIEALAAEYEDRVRGADGVADRLRREAARVTGLARLRADEGAATAETERLASARAELDADAATDHAAWVALWEPAGILPLPAAEMRPWLTRHAALVAAVEQLRAAAADAAELDTRIATLKEELLAALDLVKEQPAGADLDLASLVARAARVAGAIETAARDRRESAEAQAAHALVATRCARERDLANAALAEWKEAWKAAVLPLGIDAQTAPEEALAITDELGELFRCVDDAQKTRRRVVSIERDAALFAADVAQLARQHAPELSLLACEEAASQLHERYQQGRLDRAARAQHDADIEEKRRRSAEQAERATRADQALAALMHAARVETLDALEEAERKSDQARAITREMQAAEQLLLDAGEGATIDALLLEIKSQSADELAARLDDIEARLKELEEELTKDHTLVARLNFGLEKLSHESGAADAAGDAQEALARVRRHVDRYVRVRLASIVLAREIERYREKNQAPVLGLASDFYKRLTLSNYEGLRAGFDDKDQPVLRCVRSDGREIDVEGLSDGTRDQLYLALRLASLERHARANGAVPLVFDDILIHFDDERARAALQILGEFAMHTQILFFTHHARLVALAREALPPSLLGVHELGDAQRSLATTEAQA